MEKIKSAPLCIKNGGAEIIFSKFFKKVLTTEKKYVRMNPD